MDMERIRVNVAAGLEWLRTKKVDLEKELSEKRELHATTWQEYGSELCVGGMIAVEQRLVTQIANVQRKTEILEAFQRGEIELDAREAFVEQMKAADEKIAEILRTKEECAGHIARIDEVLVHGTIAS